MIACNMLVMLVMIHVQMTRITRKQTLRSLSYIRRMGSRVHAHPSFGMTPTFQNLTHRLYSQKVGVIPKEEWARTRAPILPLVWQRWSKQFDSRTFLFCTDQVRWTCPIISQPPVVPEQNMTHQFVSISHGVFFLSSQNWNESLTRIIQIKLVL